jgi:hypothetical protein
MAGTNIGNIFSAFRGGTPAPAGGAPAPANPGTSTPAGTSGIPQNQPNNPGADPANQNLTTSDPNASPLDAFKDLWKADDKGSPADPMLSPLFNVDPAKLAEATKRMDFAKVVPPDLIAKALGGDQAAFVQALNLVAQQTYGVNTHMVTNLIDQAIQKNNSRFSDSLPSRFKNFQVGETLAANPVLKHPATAPIVEALRTQLGRQHPQASAAEISQFANDYLMNFAKAIGGNKPAGTTEGGEPADFDWGMFLEPEKK